MVKHVSRKAAREASPTTVDDGAELARYGGIGMGELIRSCAKRDWEQVKDREERQREEERADKSANVWESGFAWDEGVGPSEQAVGSLMCCGWAVNNEEREGKE